MSLEVLEPFQTDLKLFGNTQEFTKYYELHKGDIDGLNTYRLNKSFKIPGYRLTKKDGVLKLKKDYAKPAPEAYGPKVPDVKETKNKVDTDVLEARVKRIEEDYLKLVDFINSRLT